MKAAYTDSYLQQPEQLHISEVVTPEPAADEIRVRVKAVSLNDFDWGIVAGKPWILRFFLGWRRPKVRISGCDIAGVIDRVGADVTRWQAGDRVFGDMSGSQFGGFAEFVCCSESAVAALPENVEYKAAAGVPQAAVLAWQALTLKGPLNDGLRILINGAGGGVGAYGVQLAKAFNIHVTGVDKAAKHAQMRSWGFDAVVDYQAEDFITTEQPYDLIIDTKTDRKPWQYCRGLSPGGAYVTVGGKLGLHLLLILFAPLIRIVTGKRLGIVALHENENLSMFARLLGEGKMSTPIDGPYPFEQLPQQLRYFLDARHQGKVVLVMADTDA